MNPGRRHWWIALGCLTLMASASGFLLRFRSGHHLGQPGLRVVATPLVDQDGKPATTHSIFLPETVLSYRSELAPVQRLELEALPRDTTFGRRLYKSEDDGFTAFVSGVLMGTDRTSIHKPEFCLPGQGLRILRRSQAQVLIERPHRYLLPVTRLDAQWDLRQKDGTMTPRGAVYVYWFLSDSRLSNDHMQRMWWLAFDLVRTGELQRWGYIGCLSPCAEGQQDAAFSRLERLIQGLVPEIQLTTGPPLASVSEATATTTAQVGLPTNPQPTDY